MNSNFEKIYNESIKNPEEFWKKVADDMFWFKKPTKILNSSNPHFLNGMKMASPILVIML